MLKRVVLLGFVDGGKYPLGLGISVALRAKYIEHLRLGSGSADAKLTNDRVEGGL